MPEFVGNGGEQVILTDDDWLIRTGGPMRGYRNGELVWTYPNHWPNLHAGRLGPRDRQPGQMIATTRLLGRAFQPPGTDVWLWAVNSDRGEIYLMTTDGLFVGTLGNGSGPHWQTPAARPGMRIDRYSLIDEHFWPTLTQPAEGPALLVAGKSHSSIVAVHGLQSLRRLPDRRIDVTPEDAARAREYAEDLAVSGIEELGRATLKVVQPDTAPTVDGRGGDWSGARWVRIDRDTEGSLQVHGGRLYAAVRSRRYRDLLDNRGESSATLFKTGGGLDLMIGTDIEAPTDRGEPAPGDRRLLVTRTAGNVRAVIYEPNVPGTDRAEAHPFSSPWRTVYIDRVEDVSGAVELAAGEMQIGDSVWALYEWAVDLDALDWQPRSGQRVLGDIGVLVGGGGRTTRRRYWHNGATNVVEDVPTEAQLTPRLWGIFEVE
jgi:hypothetical protein